MSMVRDIRLMYAVYHYLFWREKEIHKPIQKTKNIVRPFGTKVEGSLAKLDIKMPKTLDGNNKIKKNLALYDDFFYKRKRRGKKL